jgi:hypothetical protein
MSTERQKIERRIAKCIRRIKSWPAAKIDAEKERLIRLAPLVGKDAETLLQEAD